MAIMNVVLQRHGIPAAGRRLSIAVAQHQNKKLIKRCCRLIRRSAPENLHSPASVFPADATPIIRLARTGPANKGRLQYDFENYHFQYDVGTIIDMQYTIRTAVIADQKQTMALLPSLADFNVPPHRNPDHLWQGDARLLEKYFNHETPDTHALVAVGAHSKVQGIAIYTMRDEFLSGEPAAHLEVLAVSTESRKQGIGRALIDATESAARHLGAKSLTLHVFSNNTRARKLYASAGFDEELLRCYKEIQEPAR